MRSSLIAWTALALLMLSHRPLLAQVSTSGALDQDYLERIGLERSWMSRVELAVSRGRVEHVTMHVSKESTFRVFEVTYNGGGYHSFSERHLDRFGDPLGIRGARLKANALRDQLQSEGLEAQVRPREVPDVLLLVQTDQALLQAIDGETGRTKWTIRCGRPDFPSTAAAANETKVAVVNGSTLYVIDRETGTLLWQRTTTGAPGAGPAIGEYLVFVPTMGGALEQYLLENPHEGPEIIHVGGQCSVQPHVSENSVSWPNDRGHLYVGHADQKGLRFRLQALDTIPATPLHGTPNRLYCTSVDGYAYCIHEFSGNILWRFSAGVPIRQPAVPVHDDVFVATDDSGMYCVDNESGDSKWWATQVVQFLSASSDRAYTLGERGDLRILDRETGGLISTLSLEGIDLFIINPYTDRIYLGRRDGMLQCVHEVGSPWPTMNLIEIEEELPEVLQLPRNNDADDAEPPLTFD